MCSISLFLPRLKWKDLELIATTKKMLKQFFVSNPFPSLTAY
jgi:hypothetical protein